MTLPAPDEPSASAPRTPRISGRTVLAVLAVGLLVTVVLFGAVMALAMWVPGVRSHLPLVLAWSFPVHGLLSIVLIAAVLRRAGVTRAQVGLVRPGWRLLHLLWQIPLIIVVIALVNMAAFSLLGQSEAPKGSLDALVLGLDPLTLVGAFVGVAVLGPFWEELVFRGVVLGWLRRWGTLAAVVGSAALFAVAHGFPPLLPYLVAAGLAFAWLRLFHRNLWAPIIMHMAVNSIASSAILAALG